ncbi:hypothetical protein [Pararhodospirillum oryzae]|uniref:Phosphoribosyl-AMP cyclohydrolase n=1 Tax=Pararhodospirillum oryzae TaxID=478448 RepID=A0A512H7G8_9PROT|nr:hypothetical protein [Pararhodospirillum oryzae]GEO81399.1 hypothetical protein ROR02_15300 [Pararhodospirillum oryzae]
MGLPALVGIVLFFTLGVAQATPVTEAEVLAAEKAWGDGIVAIGKAATQSHGAAVRAAQHHLDTLYGYGLGPVLFKPTKAAADQFRETSEQALSYFVGGIVPEDHGFALNPWTHVRFENHGMLLGDNYAVAMGNYYFTPPSGPEVKVEYTFGYMRDAQGHLRIDVHHSSLPYQPAH